MILCGYRLENQNLQLQDDHIMSVLVWGQDRITRLTDLVNSSLAFLWTIPSQDALEVMASETSNIGVNLMAAWLGVVTFQTYINMYPIRVLAGAPTIPTAVFLVFSSSRFQTRTSK
jgi:hypothetical protein